MVAVSFTALFRFLFWGGVVGVVYGLGEVVQVLCTGRFVTAILAFLLLGEGGVLASLSAFFFWVLGILLLSLEFGDAGLYLLVFAMMEIGTSGVRAASEVDGYRLITMNTQYAVT